MQKYYILHDIILACCLSQWALLVMGVIAWAILSAKSYPWRRSRTLRVTKNTTEPTIVAQSGSRLFEAIKFGHEMPGAMDTHRTDMAQHWIGRLRELPKTHTHTHTALAEAIIARRLDRVCSVKYMKFANEMPSASLMAWTHWIDMTQYGKVPDGGVVHFFAPGFLYHSADVKKNKKI